MSGKLLACFLSMLAASALLTGCSVNRTTGLEQLSEELISQIDREQDEHLSAMRDKSISELLTLHSITYGSFTENDSSEMLVLFKVREVPHAGGLDRTVAAVYDADSCKLKNQKTFIADNVSVELLADRNQRKHVLFIGCVISQGYSVYSIELFKVEKDEWVSKAVSPEAFGDNYAYALSGNDLQVFELSYSDHSPVYNYKYTLFWDTVKATFERKLP